MSFLATGEANAPLGLVPGSVKLLQHTTTDGYVVVPGPSRPAMALQGGLCCPRKVRANHPWRASGP